MMKFLVLNLPNKHRLTRRYMCSYDSTTHLFPPLELLSCASIIRNFKDTEVHFLDAIAERTPKAKINNFITKINPQYIITLIGFECFSEDMQVIENIKKHAPHVKIIAFGHYPTIFKKEILSKSSIDIILEGEPEMKLYNFLQEFLTQKSHIALNTTISDNAQSAERIRFIADLPAPAYDLIDHRFYSETLMPKPFGMIQTARGCPYTCNYCVRSYGARLSLRTPAQILEEIKMLKELHGIKSLRFIDDTFTINAQRVIDICKLMIEHRVNLKWTCLSRTDNIKDNVLVWMKKAGCQRIYFGVESGSQRMLDLYEKGVNKDEAKTALIATRKAGIESVGFFMVGFPDENEADFIETMQFSIDSKLSLASIGGIVLYPGTPLYERHKDQIDFSLFPYINKFRDERVEKAFLQKQSLFYKNFYMRPTFIAGFLAQYALRPASAYHTVKEALHYNMDFGFMPGISKKRNV
jgi:anaerobic magnesium-protoporphyrin IX monomethyl ester cyclase